MKCFTKQGTRLLNFMMSILQWYLMLKIKQLKKQNKEKQEIKILTPKQLLQRLPTALAPLKAGNNSENILNEIR